MPSSFAEPSPSLPMYIPGRKRMCSRQSSDRMLDSLYSILSFAISQMRRKKGQKNQKGLAQKIEEANSSLKKGNFRCILFISVKIESTNLDEDASSNSLVINSENRYVKPRVY